MEKIDSSIVRTEDEWSEIFKSWTDKMDSIYSPEERHDATMWNFENPAEWMELYNNDVFEAWIEYDSFAVETPYFDKLKFEGEVKELIKDIVYDDNSMDIITDYIYENFGLEEPLNEKMDEVIEIIGKILR